MTDALRQELAQRIREKKVLVVAGTVCRLPPRTATRSAHGRG